MIDVLISALPDKLIDPNEQINEIEVLAKENDELQEEIIKLQKECKIVNKDLSNYVAKVVDKLYK